MEVWWLIDQHICCCSALTHVRCFATQWTAAPRGFLSFTISWSLLKLMFVELVIPSNHLIFSCPLLLLPSVFLSIRVFSSESALHIRWPKDWSFSFNISPSNEDSGLISWRIDWFALLAVQGTLKSLQQHHSSKALIFQCSAYFVVQFSHLCMTTRKIVALTIRIFVGKVSSLNQHIFSFYHFFPPSVADSVWQSVDRKGYVHSLKLPLAASGLLRTIWDICNDLAIELIGEEVWACCSVTSLVLWRLIPGTLGGEVLQVVRLVERRSYWEGTQTHSFRTCCLDHNLTQGCALKKHGVCSGIRFSSAQLSFQCL